MSVTPLSGNIIFRVISGLYPVQSLKSSEFQNFTFLSPIGIWTIGVAIFHVFIAQSTLLIAYLVSPSKMFSFPVSDLDSKLVVALNVGYMSYSYAMYLIYFVSLPKYLKFSKYITEYDQKYNYTLHLTKFQLKLLKIFHLIIWSITPIMGFFAGWTTSHLVGTVDESVEYFESYSFLTRFLNIKYNSGLIGWITGIHIFCINFATGFAAHNMIVGTRILLERIKRSERIIEFYQRSIETSKWAWNSKVSAWSQLVFDIDTISNQVRDWFELFEVLRSMSNGIILMVMAYGTINLSMLVYYISSKYELLFEWEKFNALNLFLLVYLTIIISSILLMSTVAEQLFRKAKSFRKLIVSISPKNFSSKETVKLDDLKYLIQKLDFKLSGYGFFVLNRSTVTSILSAVITYNVVLIQFQNTNSRYPRILPLENYSSES